MKLYTYVVARDYGFAPNPFFGQCTLATCKPVIRRVAQVGDWVAGTGARRYGLGGRLVYAMRVGETLTFDEYWEELRFRPKRPNLHGSLKQAFGDNIYHRDPFSQRWCQAKSHHSHGNGQTNSANVESDTGVNRVLVSDWFVYFGKEAIEIPTRFQQGEEETVIRMGRGHLVNFRSGFEEEFIQWVRSLGAEGFRGEPMEFRGQLTRTGIRRRK
ncbi:Nmad2 family putative nucleotide modification protein [Archangium violaceum]|uniref:Nmad2 family putative nucleotide modification protein n=1 Tax=Archangium violaceum TaxID=83451 RepID=UPI0036D9FF63